MTAKENGGICTVLRGMTDWTDSRLEDIGGIIHDGMHVLSILSKEP